MTSGLGVTTQWFGTSKSLAKKAAAAPKAVAHTNGEGDDAAALARGVKELVARYGAAAVKNMTDVFAE